MLKKMVSRSKHFGKMESLAMKGNHPLDTYGGIFVIVLIVKRKKFLKKIIPGERKDLLSFCIGYMMVVTIINNLSQYY